MTDGQNIAVRKRKCRLCKVMLGLAALIILLGFLLFDRRPAIEAAPPPDAAQVRAAKALFERAQAASKIDQPMALPASWQELTAAAALSGQFGGSRRIGFSNDQDALRIDASVPAIWGFWLNVRVAIPPSDTGFPAVHGRIGSVPIPHFFIRGLIWVARKVAKARGADIPPPQDIVHSLAINSDGLVANVVIPRDAKRFFAIALGAEMSPDPAGIARRYCALGQEFHERPASDFSEVVRRTFATAPDRSAVTNRANFVALAMLVVSKRVGDLVGVDRAMLQGCAPLPIAPLLEGRADLSKHWAMSAALAATVGSNLSDSMGVWKEISDSGPAGSGFSFIDLAADRSGVYFAARATDPATAEATAKQLTNSSNAALLPKNALMLAEGLSEAQFKARYQSVDSGEYAAMVRRIDAILRKVQ